MHRLITAFRHSQRGLTYAIRTQAAIRQELLLLAIGVALAFMLDVAPLHRLLLIGSLLLVILVELINSAIEATIDRISTEPHPLAGAAKDMGSAAVLVALCIAALTWATVLFF